MPSKRGSSKAKTVTSKSINKKKKNDFIDDREEEIEEFDASEEFRNSEDGYNSENSTTGGDSASENQESENELGPDETTHELDVDDEKDPNEEDKYDPIDGAEEVEDPDEEIEKEEVEEVEEEIAEEDAIDEDLEAEKSGESKTCYLKKLNKDFIILDEDDSNIYGKIEQKKISDEDRVTDSVLTYYEMVRIIGTRAQQFNFGARPLVKGLDGLHPAKMAYLELVAKMTPFIVRRFLPGKKYEDWRIDELEIIHQISDKYFVPEKFDYESLMKQAKIYKENEAKSSNARITGNKSTKSKSSRKTTKSSNKTTKSKSSNKIKKPNSSSKTAKPKKTNRKK